MLQGNFQIFRLKLGKAIILSAILILSLTIFVGIAFAGSVTVDGTLDTGDKGTCPYGDVFEFTVSQTGTYSIPTISPPTFTVDNFFIVWVSIHPGLDFIDVILGRNNISQSQTGTLNAGTTYYIHARGSNSCAETVYPMDYSFTLTGPGDIICTTCNPVVVSGVVVVEDDDSIPLPAFYDGRINDYDSAAPIAVYPHEVDGETGLIIYSAEGVELLVISPQQIADAPDNPDTNTLIVEANGVSLHRLVGGAWQVNAPQYNGKTYVVIFPELFHSGGYESFELEG